MQLAAVTSLAELSKLQLCNTEESHYKFLLYNKQKSSWTRGIRTCWWLIQSPSLQPEDLTSDIPVGLGTEFTTAMTKVVL